MQGSATDDGLPSNTLTYTWTKQSGPGDVTFANTNVAQTTAAFSQEGTYLLRLSVSDGEFASSDEITITVNPAPINQPPTVDAGQDQSATINSNLVRNPSGEETLVGGEIAGWTEVQGDVRWSQRMRRYKPHPCRAF